MNFSAKTPYARRIFGRVFCSRPEGVETYIEPGRKRENMPKLFRRSSSKKQKVLFSCTALEKDVNIRYTTISNNMRHPYVWPTARLTFLISGAQLGSDIRIGLLSIGSHHTPTLWGTFARATVFVIAFTFRII